MDTAKLVAARLRKGWSQEKLAEEMEIGISTVQRWERGECEPRGYNRQRLGEVLGLTPEELLGVVVVQVELPLTLSRSEPIKILQSFMKHDLTMHLWSLASQPYQTYQEVHGAMTRILKDYDSMNTKNYHITRRNALLRLVTLPFATLGGATFAGEGNLTPNTIKDILAQCAVSIAACWELRKSTEHSDLTMTFNGVSAYLPTLQRIVKDSSQYRQEAASLATQCLLLQSLLAQHVEGSNEAMQYAQQALPYSNASKDISLQLKALERLAVVYSYGRRHKQALQTIDQAVPLLKRKGMPLPLHLQACINGMLACAHARNGQDGKSYLDQASMLLPETDNGCPVYVAYEQSGLLLDTGIVYSYHGESTKALEALSQLVDPETFVLKKQWSEMGRIETINTMTMVTLKAKDKDMEKTIHFWTAAIEAAKALRSEQRFNEAVAAYDIMDALWPGEMRIAELRELTQHW